MGFFKVAVLEPSSLQSSSGRRDITNDTRRIKTYVYPFLLVATNGFPLWFSYRNPYSSPESSKMRNVRNLPPKYL